MSRRAQICTLLLALGLYLPSLFLPALICKRDQVVQGFQVLLTGWIGIFVLDPRWYANLGFIWIFICVAFKRKPPGPFVVLITAACSVASPLLPALGCGDGAGAAAMSVGLGTGGYLWMVAMFASVVAAIGYDASIPISSSFDSTEQKENANVETSPGKRG